MENKNQNLYNLIKMLHFVDFIGRFLMAQS